MRVGRRRLSAYSWMVVAAVLLRAASGGGGLGGFLYAAAAEPRASYAAGVILFAVSVVLSISFATSQSVSLPRFSALLSVPAFLYAGWWYVLDDHASGLVIGAAALGAFVLGFPVAIRQFLDGRGKRPSPRRASQPLKPERWAEPRALLAQRDSRCASGRPGARRHRVIGGGV
ncbi:MAG: hypothetical protein M3067_08865 [Chloroflexota bacterium]|nr:hypothetical protein [Chloroflexota bacterium]